MRRIASEAVRQHVENTAFLWAQRDTLAAEDPPDAAALSDIGRRIETNLDGLRIAGAAAWPRVETVLEDFPDKGEVFVAGWLAIEQADPQRIEQSIGHARRVNDPRGLVGALAWHEPARIAPLVRDWLGEHDAFKRYLGVAACAEHGVDPRERLTRLVQDPDAKVRAHALKLAGLLKRADLSGPLTAALDADEEEVRLWAGWALAELGAGAPAREELRRAAVAAGPDALAALRAATRIGPEKDVRAWLGSLMARKETAAVAVRGIGMLGDRLVLPWLIAQMRVPPTAVAACAAFLELFPEAREETKLFTADPSALGSEFAKHFGDDVVRVASPDAVEGWRIAGESGRA